jgi:hypothetical protein
MRFNKKAIICLFISLSAIPSQSWAGILLEPYVGYGLFGSFSRSGTDLGSYNGFGFGGRGGITILDTLFGAVDFSSFPSLGVDTTTSSVLGGGTANTKLGLVAGVNIPILPFRFWVGYNFLDKMNNTYSGQENSLSGHSFKLGAGFKLIPLVSLNAEYIITNYNDLSAAGTSIPLPGGDSITGKMILFSASVPLSI